MSSEGGGMLMMRGMTAKNFDPIRYAGRWFEVASLKRGFAGQGQEDCHCTQVKALEQNFCVVFYWNQYQCFTRKWVVES